MYERSSVSNDHNVMREYKLIDIFLSMMTTTVSMMIV